MNDLERDIKDLMDKYPIKEILEVIAFWLPEKKESPRGK